MGWPPSLPPRFQGPLYWALVSTLAPPNVAKTHKSSLSWSSVGHPCLCSLGLSWRQGQPHGGGGISLCPSLPLAPTRGQLLLLGFKAGSVAQSSHAPGGSLGWAGTWSGSSQDLPASPRSFLADSLRAPGGGRLDTGHRPSWLVGPNQLSVWPQPKPGALKC